MARLGRRRPADELEAIREAADLPTTSIPADPVAAPETEPPPEHEAERPRVLSPRGRNPLADRLIPRGLRG